VGGVCEVSLEAETREKIDQLITRDPVPELIFDEALEMLVNDMLESFRQFKKSSMFQDARLDC
jgi:ribosomal protein L19E